MNTASLDTILQIFKWILNTIFHQCVAVLACYMIWIPIENYSNTLSWHVILCTLGVFPFMAQSLILFFPSNVWSQEVDRKQKYWIHTILIALAIAFEICGVAVGIYHKTTIPNEAHFQSAHAVLGLLSIILIVFGVISGFMSFNTLKFEDWARPAWFKLGHNVIGQVTYLFFIITLVLGVFTEYFSSYTSEASRIAATVVSVIVAMWSLTYAWKSTYTQIISISVRS